MAPDLRQSRGQTGEDLACAELVRRGYAILARRFRTRAGEIDIVASQADTLVFVEVKARVGSRFGGGAVAVTPWKQRRIALVATEYLTRHGGVDQRCRFDVVTVDLDGDGTAGVASSSGRVEVFPHAFDAPA